jgi:hypothetical protein
MVLISSILSRGSYWLERQKGRLACLMQEIARSAVLWLLCVYHYQHVDLEFREPGLLDSGYCI